MSETKDFHIGDILSVTTGRLVSPEHIGGVYKILNWMTSENLMTHQLPRASRECEPFLKAQHPDLSEIVVPDSINSEETLLFWLAGVTEQFDRPDRGAKDDASRHADHRGGSAVRSSSTS